MSLKLTVVVPTFNGGPWINDTLTSVYQQTKLPHEIIVVDDCSTDETLAIVRSLQPKSPVPLGILQLDSNSGGPAKPTNVGIHAASSDLIAVLDQDDVFAPNKLELQSSFLNAHPHVACVGGAAGDWHSRTSPPQRIPFAPSILDGAVVADDGWILRPGIVDQILRHGMFLIGFPSLMFRRSAWEQIGGIDERWKIVGDFDFLCRLCTTGQLGLQDQVVYFRRNHANNLSGRRIEMYLEDARVRDRLLQHPELRDNRQLLETMARHCLWVSRGFREDAEYPAARQMLHWARRFGADRRTLRKQSLYLIAHQWLYTIGLKKRVPSGITRAPWTLAENSHES